MSADDVPQYHWAFDQLVRVEEHWTSQRQNQQARVATTLTVTGVMLTLLAPLVLGHDRTWLTGWAHAVLVSALIALGLALFPGIAALWPKTDPDSAKFIDSEYFKRLSADGGLVKDATAGEPNVDWSVLVASFPDSGVAKALIEWRRKLIKCQLALLVVAGAARWICLLSPSAHQDPRRPVWSLLAALPVILVTW